MNIDDLVVVKQQLRGVVAEVVDLVIFCSELADAKIKDNNFSQLIVGIQKLKDNMRKVVVSFKVEIAKITQIASEPFCKTHSLKEGIIKTSQFIEIGVADTLKEAKIEAMDRKLTFGLQNISKQLSVLVKSKNSDSESKSTSTSSLIGWSDRIQRSLSSSCARALNFMRANESKEDIFEDLFADTKSRYLLIKPSHLSANLTTSKDM